MAVSDVTGNKKSSPFISPFGQSDPPLAAFFYVLKVVTRKIKNERNKEKK
jgi:hypothetical protein